MKIVVKGAKKLEDIPNGDLFIYGFNNEVYMKTSKSDGFGNVKCVSARTGDIAFVNSKSDVIGVRKVIVEVEA